MLLNIKNYEKWLNRRLLELVAEVKVAQATTKRRKQSAKRFTFPFPSTRPRPSRADSDDQRRNARKPAYAHPSPHRTGENDGRPLSCLRRRVKRGQKIIYATPKNSQHAVAEEAIDKLQIAEQILKL